VDGEKMWKHTLASILLLLLMLGSTASISDLHNTAHAEGITSKDTALVAYWSFDEGSGGVAHDNSGNGNDGTIYGAAWTSGVSGSALSFDGRNDYVMIPSSASLDIRGSITLEAWVKYNDILSQHQIIWRGDTQIAHDPYFLIIYDHKIYFARDVGNGDEA